VAGEVVEGVELTVGSSSFHCWRLEGRCTLGTAFGLATHQVRPRVTALFKPSK